MRGNAISGVMDLNRPPFRPVGSEILDSFPLDGSEMRPRVRIVRLRHYPK